MFWPQAVPRSGKEGIFGNMWTVAWGPGRAPTVWPSSF